MSRLYSVSELSRTINRLSRFFPDAAIGADVIVGFVNEGSKEYENTYAFVNSHPFTNIHVFPYSPRPGTASYASGDPVSQVEKKKRLWRLKNLVADKNFKFRQRLLNKTFNVIVEYNRTYSTGLTDNYITVQLEDRHPVGKMVNVLITRVTPQQTYGEVLKPANVPSA
jgi:threonylcarbamoyladenosine tRNA methylthiotransferase MtaB